MAPIFCNNSRFFFKPSKYQFLVCQLYGNYLAKECHHQYVCIQGVPKNKVPNKNENETFALSDVMLMMIYWQLMAVLLKSYWGCWFLIFVNIFSHRKRRLYLILEIVRQYSECRQCECSITWFLSSDQHPFVDCMMMMQFFYHRQTLSKNTLQ